MHPPVSLTRLVGRSRELGDLEGLVGTQRLVTLTGVGGAGKTRLALELAARTEAAWVELAACMDPMLVVQQTASTLGVRDSSLADALRERELLLVLDNCEHVVDACASLATTLLSQCARLRILATSREPLGIPGERVWPVPPIAVAEGVELFAERASAVAPGFVVDDANRGAIEEICRRLDGIPLAIELAAARIRVLTPVQITERLADRFAILSGGARTAMPRHRTLRAAIDWSFALLTDREQALMAQLSVFAGSFSLDAAERVCGDADVLDVLVGLVDKSLVVASSSGGEVRYSLLETIREYAAERLSDAGLRRRHALTFLGVAQDALPDLLSGAYTRLDRLELDHDNVRAALTWSLDHEPDAIALPLAASFRWFWYYRIQWSEGLHWMTRTLERTASAPSRDRAAVLAGAGTFTSFRGDLTLARTWLEEAESMFRELGDDRQLALTLASFAQLLASAGDIEQADRRATEAVALARRNGSAYEVGYALTNGAAFVSQKRGQWDEADQFLEEAEAIYAPTRHPLGYPFVLNARALLALRRHDPRTAARFARTALLETRGRRELWFSSRSLRILAFTATGDPLRAARLLAASDAMLRSIGAGVLPHEKQEHDRAMASLREQLPAGELEAALQEGSRMAFEDACALALANDAGLAPNTSGVLHVRDLGPLEITSGGKPLVAEGRSSSRARELLAYLLVHPEGRTKDDVGLAFWPDATSEQVKNSFHVTLHRLRKLLGSADAIVADAGRYRVSVPHVADSQRFESEVKAALRSRDAGALESALGLYRDEYLAGEETGEWAAPIRKHLRQLYLRALFALGQALETRGRPADAADAYRRIVDEEPLDEAAWRQLMICRARAGSRSESLLLYRELEERLRADLQTVPESATRALYERLRQNESV
jgi:predicted ATPase/DNA-binding SARP family transcriptional activator